MSQQGTDDYHSSCFATGRGFEGTKNLFGSKPPSLNSAPNIAMSRCLDRIRLTETGLVALGMTKDLDCATTDSDPVTGLLPRQPESGSSDHNPKLSAVIVYVDVRATLDELNESQPTPRIASAHEIDTAAGTFGDVGRFLQSMPGVVASNDSSNDLMVRGGHPIENLFLVEGIEVPNLNHLATVGSTGGFATMIDTGVLDNVKFYSGGYDSKYPERLSSVTEFTTLNPQHSPHPVEMDLGIDGAGGIIERHAFGGSLLASAHHGLLNLFTSNIGMNGVPTYTNEFSRFERQTSGGSRISLLNLAGWDSISITPCASDADETSTINTQYAGWRETTGGQWQRINSQRSFGVLTFSDSEQVESIHQQDQIPNPSSVTHIHLPCPIPSAETQATPVYGEHARDAFSTVGYSYEWTPSRFTLNAGTGVWIARPDIKVEQPLGNFTPYSATPARRDASSFDSSFASTNTGTFATLSFRPVHRLSISLGGRVQTFAFGGNKTVTPRVSLRYRMGESSDLHATYASYAQLPPYMDLVSYPINHALLPMRATHEIVGLELGSVPRSAVSVELYRKEYSDIPSSIEYPSVTLHSMSNQFGQQITWLPMSSGGRGIAYGAELTDATHLGRALTVHGTLAYARAKFAGLDGILRPSDFDLPLIANISTSWQASQRYQVTGRFGYTSGRPYTPFDLTDSLTQNRPIYKTDAINQFRSPMFCRLDFQVKRSIETNRVHLEIYAGLNNALNRSNFLAYAWMPRRDVGSSNRNPVTEINQMPIFPNFGLRASFW